MSWRSQQNRPLQSHNTHFHNFPELPNGEHQHLSRTHQEANHLLGGAVHHTTESFHHSLRTESVALVTQSAAVNHGAHQKSLRNVVLKECQCCPVLRHCAKPATAIYLPLKLPFLKRTDVMPRLRGDTGAPSSERPTDGILPSLTIARFLLMSLRTGFVQTV